MTIEDPRPTIAVVDHDIPPSSKGPAVIVRIDPDGGDTEQELVMLLNPGTVALPAGTRCYIHELDGEWTFKNFV